MKTRNNATSITNPKWIVAKGVFPSLCRWRKICFSISSAIQNLILYSEINRGADGSLWFHDSERSFRRIGQRVEDTKIFRASKVVHQRFLPICIRPVHHTRRHYAVPVILIQIRIISQRLMDSYWSPSHRGCHVPFPSQATSVFPNSILGNNKASRSSFLDVTQRTLCVQFIKTKDVAILKRDYISLSC